MSVKRMDNVGIVVEDLDAAIEFFTELGLQLEGRAPVEGTWADGDRDEFDIRGLPLCAFQKGFDSRGKRLSAPLGGI